MLSIGPHTLRNRAVLAPMAGLTDLPFRQLAWRLGAGYVVSEMTAAKAELWHTRKSELRRRRDAQIRPWAVQIAGGDAQTVARAAIMNARLGADVIDVNMGCPAKKVCRKAAGSALLRDERLVAEILERTVAAVAVPVTLKMRTGWSPDQRNAVRVARIAEQAGVRLLSVHGRTRACRFAGAVEYETIAAVKDAVRIPVLANGDIGSCADAADVLRRTGADGVMIGRAALGAPWLPGRIAEFLETGVEPAAPSRSEKFDIATEHVRGLHAFYGSDAGLRIARKHVKWYLEGMSCERGAIRAFTGLESASAQLDWLAALAESEGGEAPARAA